jgi:hypothetical protein
VATNTALGYQALNSNTNTLNTAVGYRALTTNTSGQAVTAVGSDALRDNSTGSRNTAVGYGTLANNNTGENNSAVGQTALGSNTTGTNNSALGYDALGTNTSGAYNTALGKDALNKNTTASNNTAVGYQAGYTGSTNCGNSTLIGYQAGYTQNNGIVGASENTFVGYKAGYGVTTGVKNTFIGGGVGGGVGAGGAVTTGFNNTILGTYTGDQGGLDIRTANNYIVLSDGDGNPRLYMNGSGNIFWGGIRANAGSYAVKLTTSGEQVFDTSSARYKDNIRDNVYGLDAVMQMRSAQFEYKDDGRSDVGFIAEEMVQVIPEVVVIDKQGRPDAVAYDRITSVLVKAIQELKAEVDSLKAQINGASA